MSKPWEPPFKGAAQVEIRVTQGNEELYCVRGSAYAEHMSLGLSSDYGREPHRLEFSAEAFRLAEATRGGQQTLF